jgi:hypothetical protein
MTTQLKILVFLFLLGCSVSIQAQYFKGGLLIGMTGSQMDGDNMAGYNKIGFTGGMFVRSEFSYKWGMQAELKFVMKGAASSLVNNSVNSLDNNGAISRLTLYYYELPILLTYRASKKIEFEGGLAFAYLGGASIDKGYGAEDLSYPINKNDYSFIAGISYLINEKFSINSKFSYSLRPVSHQVGNMTIWGTYGQYNHLLELALYYKIN